ncbi:MAG: hypothetical protein JNN12_03685 [Bacteroidetes Order II. Incertae sedis bacterium]|nr:hypothetical protein [Bacteroidetes Order II. bacterium]
MSKSFLWFLAGLALALGGCRHLKPTHPAETCNDFSGWLPSEQKVAQHILLHGLDHEALYTLAADLKPMSTIDDFSFHTDSLQAAIPQLTLWANIGAKLSCNGKKVVLVPFKNEFDGRKYVELLALDVNRVQKEIRRHPLFWAKLGITEATPVELIPLLVESAAKYDRWRGFGYLFGYPDYAVDFFVQAGQEQDSTKQFVKRDFFQIPVFAAEKGHFTYAMPKGHTPALDDSTRYVAAQKILARYRLLRAEQLRSGTIDAKKLLRNLQKKP